MKITYPKIKSPSSGLSYSRGVWSAAYRVDGIRRTRSMGVIHLADAIILRDAFYAELGANGASVHAPAATGPKNPTYISFRKPWRLKIGKTVIGDYLTHEEAEVAKAAWLGR